MNNVAITDVFRDQSDKEYLIIKGSGFTKYSKVFIDDTEIECELMDPNTIRVRMDKVENSINVIVKQSYKGKLTLQTSNTLTYNGAGEEGVQDGEENHNGTANPQPSPAAQQNDQIDWGSLIDEEAAQKSAKE